LYIFICHSEIMIAKNTLKVKNPCFQSIYVENAKGMCLNGNDGK
jgi:hypothetical protein